MIRTRRASAREVSSWALYDFANSAFATTILAVIFNRYYAGVVAGGEAGVAVPWFGDTVQVPGATMFTYAVTISMLIVAITAPLLGALADSIGAKKRFLFGYALLGIVTTGLLATVGEGDWVLGAVWFILANIGFAGGNVYYNAFLPELADSDEMGRVSGFGWGLGYLGGGLLLALNLIMLEAPGLLGFAEGTFTVQHCFFSVAVWWGVFAIPIFARLRERANYRKQRITSTMREGAARLRSTFSRVREYKQLWRFLLAYLFFNDGIETVILMAAIFADQELAMGQGMIVAFFLLIQFTAFAGSALFGRVAQRSGNKPALMVTLVIWCLVVIDAYFIGWTGYPVTEYFVLGVVAGLVMGASQALARALQGQFTPVRHEAEFYGFFAVSGRFASVLGPLTYGTLVLVTGSLRWGILSVFVFFLLGLVLLARVDVAEGLRVANRERIPETPPEESFG